MTITLSGFITESKASIKLAYPVIIGQLGNILVGIIDSVMIGDLGTSSLAAVSVCNAAFYIILMFGVGVSNAITALIAEAEGANKLYKSMRFYKHGMYLCIVVSLGIWLILWGVIRLFPYFGQPAEVTELAIPFLTIIGFSYLPLMIYQAVKQTAEGLSYTKLGMYTSFVIVGLNIIFNYVLINGKWGFPRLEVNGAAYGTLLARVLTVGMAFFFALRHPKMSKVVRSVQWRHFNLRYLLKIWRVGMPIGFQMLFEVGAFGGAAFIAGLISTQALAAHQIAINVAVVTYMVGFGLGMAATVRVGNALGRKNYEEVRTRGRYSFMLASVVMGAFAILYFFIKGIVPTWFINDIEVIRLAEGLLIITALFQLSDGLQVVGLGALRGVQDVKITTYIMFVAYWLLAIPLSYVLGVMTPLGINGVWIGLAAGLSFGAAAMYFRFEYYSKKLLRTAR